MERFIDNLIELYEKLSSWEHEVVRGTELSLQQMHTVGVIGSFGEIRMKELAQKLGVTTGTLTVMIQRLEQLSMVIRKKSETDGRSFTITLTEKGKENYEIHHRSHKELSQELAQDLTQDELDQFNLLLERVVKNF